MIKEELLNLYLKYCEEIDDDSLHFTYHQDFKNSFSEFMFWLENDYINWFGL